MTRILLTGKNGQVGWELQRTLATLGNVIALDRQGMDLASPDSIRNAIRNARPNIIVNAAAYTAVDKAESDHSLAMAVNGDAPGIIAEEAKRLGAGVVHYSTDYVFDGAKAKPYIETDVPHPINVYGKTKLAGERAIQAVGVPHLILRTSWVYGARGRNFLLTILRLAAERDELKIVNDQIGAPTWSRMIAESTLQILVQLSDRFTSHAMPLADISGIYHLTAGGQTSWYGFAKAAFEIPFGVGINTMHALDRPTPKLIPIPTSEYPLPASRPAYSIMSCDKLHRVFGLTMQGWESGLRLCMENFLP
ncbi:MAG: dTDP-4-dehydrorhamnose reductase [Gammaproteobacteria bacterium]|nr:MAG: dTDP-4-dehydrorhamnose reductase [Gammaproteobacteria bacterium]